MDRMSWQREKIEIESKKIHEVQGLTFKVRGLPSPSRGPGVDGGEPWTLDVGPRPFFIFYLLSFIFFCLYPASLWGDTYTIHTKDQWEKWTYNGIPLGELGDQGVVNLTADGRIELGRVVKGEINVAPDALRYTYQRDNKDFEGGIRAAGSNKSQAKRIIDGRLDTYWAPNPSDDVETWWVELDLGYGITAKKVRLVFAEGKVPFPEFKIFVSDGVRKYLNTNSPALDYVPIAITRRPNEKSVFEVIFDEKDHYLESGGTVTNGPDDPETVFLPERNRLGQLLLGRPLQYIKIFFTSKVEDPGLAEVEVYSIGQNVAQGLLERKGWVEVQFPIPAPENLFDGRLWEPWWISDNVNWLAGGWFKLDLGNVFWLDTIRVLQLDRSKATQWFDEMNGFKIYVSDGTEAAYSTAKVWKVHGKNLVWNEIVDVRNTDNPRQLYFDLTFPSVRARYIFFRHAYGLGYGRARETVPSNIVEFQMYGEGVIPGVTLVSDLIDLGHMANITALSWEADTPPGTKVEFRTRTGNEVETISHYYSRFGKEVTKDVYDKLKPFQKGKIETETAPVEAMWSGWSTVYKKSGGGFLSPSPRRYLLIEARLVSEDPDVAPVLKGLTLHFTQPAVTEIYGRISPQEAFPGRSEAFLFRIRRPGGGRVIRWHDNRGREITKEVWYESPAYRRGTVVEETWLWYNASGQMITQEVWEALDPSLRGEKEKVREQEISGFDEVLIRTPGPASDIHLRIGGEEVELTEVPDVQGDSLVVRLPFLVFAPEDSVEVGFRSTVYVSGTLVEGFVGNRRMSGVWQRVDSDPLLKDPLVVRLPVLARTEDLIGNVKMDPETITPNGDGVHDQMTLSFDVFKVIGQRQTRVEIYDLGGQLVRRIYDRYGTSARVEGVVWDGRKEGRALVGPGVYLCKIEVDGESGQGAVYRTVRVVY